MKNRTWIRIAVLLIVGLAIFWNRSGLGDRELGPEGGVPSILDAIFSREGDDESSKKVTCPSFLFGFYCFSKVDRCAIQYEARA